jgi:alpha-glucosidase
MTVVSSERRRLPSPLHRPLLLGVVLSACAGIAAQSGQAGQQEPVRLGSPDRRMTVTISPGAAALQWSVARDGLPLIGPSSIGLTVGGRSLGAGAIRSTSRSQADRAIRTVFYPRREMVRDRYEQLTIVTSDGLTVIVRAYDDAVAYRLQTDVNGTIRVDDELLDVQLPDEPTVYAPLADCRKAAARDPGADCFHSSFEEPYSIGPLASLARDRQAFLPILIDNGPGRPKVLVSEADLEDYPGVWLRPREDGRGLRGIFPRYPTAEKIVGDAYPQLVVTSRAGYIAETSGRRSYPWRVFIVADSDDQLPASDVVHRLGGDTTAGDWSWLRPGKSQSEWLWNNMLYGVDFEAGLNTATYRHYIDFAARFGLAYLFFDAGWSKVDDPLSITPGLDVAQLVREARDRNLGVVLWTSALAVGRRMDAIMDHLQRLGATGIMVDFMDRDDQPTVRFYDAVVKAAAKRRLIVTFHGAYKPTGLERRWPNAVTREGLIAFEYDKWSDVLTPEYEVTIPFIRGVVGPVDYEPGSMRNAQRESFRAIDEAPMSQGTRMHQAAMYLVYESPYAKMGGNVSDYEREPEFTRFLSGIPTLWKETRVLDARIADYLVVLRGARDGSVWIGAMTDWTPRDLQVPLAFLPAGCFSADVWQDGPNAARYGADWQHLERSVTATDTLVIRMAPGGGYAARIAPCR